MSLLALAAPSSGAALSPAAATGAFGLDLLRKQPPGNAVLSPDSVAAALAMTGTGAAGHTAGQIARVIHLVKPAAFKRVGNLQRAIVNVQVAAGKGRADAPTLNIANGLFLQEGFSVNSPFQVGLQRHFGVAPEAVDFSGDPSGALQTINSWVSDRTRGLIPHLIFSLSPATRLALANAVFFKADWLHAFEPDETRPALFHSPRGNIQAQFMHKIDRLRYGSGRSYRAVDLPYRDSSLSLLVASTCTPRSS